MRIPDVRDRLYRLSEVHKLPELESLADQLARRKPTRRAVTPQKATVRMTHAVAALIRGYAERHPDTTQAEIARHFNVNPGRVSEALIGRRA